MSARQQFMVECHLSYGWDDAQWTVNDRPQRFKSRAEAQREIDEHCAAMREAVRLGHMDSAERRTDFRIVEA